MVVLVRTRPSVTLKAKEVINKWKQKQKQKKTERKRQQQHITLCYETKTKEDSNRTNGYKRYLQMNCLF